MDQDFRYIVNRRGGFAQPIG